MLMLRMATTTRWPVVSTWISKTQRKRFMSSTRQPQLLEVLLIAAMDTPVEGSTLARSGG
jgi:hypothetical protein